MPRLAKQAAALAFLVFLALWTAGIVAGFSLATLPAPEAPVTFDNRGNRQGQGQQFVANNARQLGLDRAPLPLLLDKGPIDKVEIIEKNAQLATSSSAFDDDEALIRAALAGQRAAIFSEWTSGIDSNRRLSLIIGVHPDRFDALVAELGQIGRLKSMTAQRRDRSAEFRDLHVQRQAKKKYLETIRKLRGAPQPSIEDTLKLEQRIQEVERELYALEGQLGELLGKESYYQVTLTLTETTPGRALASFPRRVLHAFAWAAAWWLLVAVGVASLVGTGVGLRLLLARPSAPPG